MPATDDELKALHEQATGTIRELLGELIEARKACVVARKLSQLSPLLHSSITVMRLQHHFPPEELFLALMHKKPDGTGRVGPSWPAAEFLQDLEQLSEMLLDEDEEMDLRAVGLSNIFGPKE